MPIFFCNIDCISFASLNSVSALSVVNNLLTTFPIGRTDPLHLSGGRKTHPKPPLAIAAPPKLKLFFDFVIYCIRIL